MKDHYKEMLERAVDGAIPIKIKKIEDESGKWTAWIDDPDLEDLSGCVIQADTEEEIEKELRISMKIMLYYYYSEHMKGQQRAIWRSNWSKSQFWFTIVGIGLTFYWRPKNLPFKPPKGLGLWIGRLRITFTNNWKWKKRQLK